MLSVKQGGIKYLFFKVFCMTRPGIELQSPGSLANTIPSRPIGLVNRLIILYSNNKRLNHVDVKFDW